MSCPCCFSTEKPFKISYDIYPLISPKKPTFPFSVFKKTLSNNGIQKEGVACDKCLSSDFLVKKLENQNPGMIVCHIKRIPDKKNIKDENIININSSKPLSTIKNINENKKNSIKSDDFSK